MANCSLLAVINGVDYFPVALKLAAVLCTAPLRSSWMNLDIRVLLVDYNAAGLHTRLCFSMPQGSFNCVRKVV